MRTAYVLALASVVALSLGGCNWFGGSNEPAPTLRSQTPDPAPASPTTGPVTPTTHQAPPQAFSPAPAAPATPPAPAAAGAYRVVIASYGKPENAAAAVKFLGDHGVAAVAVAAAGKTTVMSVDGFATAKEAEPLKKKVVDAGAAHPDAKKSGKSVWADAYVKQVK